MHHADAQFHRLLGRTNANRGPVEEDFPLKPPGIVDHRHAEEDVHQSGLARTIFSHDGEDFPRPHPQVYPFEHPVPEVLLGDASHFQTWRIQSGNTSFPQKTRADLGEPARAHRGASKDAPRDRPWESSN